MKYLNIIFIIIVIAAIIGLFTGFIIQKPDNIIKRTPDYLYVKEYSWYNLDSAVYKYKTDKIYTGTITHKNTSRGFVGVPGKGGHYVTRYHTTIKFNNTSYQEDGYEIYTKYQIGDKIKIKETYYPSHSITIL